MTQESVTVQTRGARPRERLARRASSISTTRRFCSKALKSKSTQEIDEDRDGTLDNQIILPATILALVVKADVK